MDSFYRGGVSELRVVLVGSIGCGKTLTADTLLAEGSGQRGSASSRACSLRRGASAGRRLRVVETPRWYWRGGQVEADVQVETRRALSLSAPGPHAFIILIPVGEFTEVEQRIPAQLERTFGPSVLNHTMVVLTCGDYLMGRSLEEYMRKEAGLQEVVRVCAGGCHVINNRKPEDRQQVISLLEKVEQMIQTTGGFYHQSEEETDVRQTDVRQTDVREEEKQKTESAGTERMWNGGMRERDERQTSRFDRNETDGQDVHVRHISSLHSESHESQESHVQHASLERNSSYKLTREGGILSQMQEVTEVKPNHSYINSIHHSIRRLSDSSESLKLVSSSSSSSSDPLPELRLVLMGRAGSGKSAAGNLILGGDGFSGGSQQCVRGRALVEDRRVVVIETPDWFRSERSPEEVKAQISSCVSLSAPGPHAFLLCVPVHRPAHEDLLALHALEGTFGPEAVRRHTLVLFTHSDLLPEGARGLEGVESYITSKRPEMLELVERCGDRYHVLQPAAPHAEKQQSVKQLLEKVEQTVKESGGDFYSCSLIQETEREIQQEQEEVTRFWRERQRDREERQNLSPSLHALKETEEEEDAADRANKRELESTRPLVSSAAASPSLLRSVWERVGSGASRIPKLIAVGALVGGALGVFFAGAVGGAVGAAVGSVLSEAGRRYTTNTVQTHNK